MNPIRRYLPFMLSSLLCALSACSTVGSEFSCNKTAGDSCLTIEQVDSMTRYADEPITTKRYIWKGHAQKSSPASRQFYLSQQDDKSGVWIAQRNRG